MKNKIFFSFIIIIFPLILFLWWFYLSYYNDKIINENENLNNSNILLNEKIDELTKWSKNLFSYLKDFYIDFFKKKFDLYIIDLWWITEYVNPTNNYTESVSFSKWININYEFKNEQINELLKIRKNIEALKKLWVIIDYKIWDIKINKKNKLLNNSNIYYQVSITMKPTENKKIIREFLSWRSEFYKKIYEKFVIKKVDEVIKKWYKNVFNNDEKNKNE